jgi:hypothetical protein
MQDWIRNKNIEEFRKLLAVTTDAEQRRLLSQLLKDEQAKEPTSKTQTK